MNQAVAKSRSESTLRIVALTAGEMSGEWSFDKNLVTVGRGAGADVRLAENKKISRLHCVFELRADGVWVKDANSINGTWLNNRRITEAKVNPEDLVSVAGIRFRVLTNSTDESTPAEVSAAAEPFFSAPKAEETPAEISNILPFRAVTPAMPVDTDRTKPEIKALEIEQPEPEAPAVVAQPEPQVAPQLAPQAPAFYVGGKRRPASGARPVAPSQGLTSGQKLVLALAVGGAVAFGGAILIVGVIAAVMLG